MKTLILFPFFALMLIAQPSIRIAVTDSLGNTTNSKITGAKASAYLDSLTKFLATQVDCSGTPQVCTPRYSDLANLLQHVTVKYAKEIEEKFPATADQVEVDTLEAAKLVVEQKRKARAEAALKEK